MTKKQKHDWKRDLIAMTTFVLIVITGTMFIMVDDMPKGVSDTKINYTYKGFPARITKYAWTGNQMANGEWPHEGACATSDRTIPFGTEIEIVGYGTCIVKDRTANWVNYKFDLPTIDLYSNESIAEMNNWGAREYNIIIN